MTGKKFLTEKQYHERIAFWKKSLGLNEWQIAVSFEDPSSDESSNLMCVTRHSKYNDAHLRIHPWCAGNGDPPIECLEEKFASPYFFEYKIVHELLHLVVRDFVFVFEHSLDGYLHRDVDTQFNNTVDLEEERLVDRLAKALVDAFGKYK